MIIHKLVLRWPSGVVEEHLFTHASYAHATYHTLTRDMMSASKPAFMVVEVEAHESLLSLGNIKKN